MAPTKHNGLKARIIRKRGLRDKVFARDGGYCLDCKRYDPHWECDHDLALWRGGPDDIDNCVTRCRQCHKRKTIGETPIRAKTDRLKARHELTKSRKAVYNTTKTTAAQ